MRAIKLSFKIFTGISVFSAGAARNILAVGFCRICETTAERFRHTTTSLPRPSQHYTRKISQRLNSKHNTVRNKLLNGTRVTNTLAIMRTFSIIPDFQLIDSVAWKGYLLIFSIVLPFYISINYLYLYSIY